MNKSQMEMCKVICVLCGWCFYVSFRFGYLLCNWNHVCAVVEGIDLNCSVSLQWILFVFVPGRTIWCCCQHSGCIPFKFLFLLGRVLGDYSLLRCLGLGDLWLLGTLPAIRGYSVNLAITRSKNSGLLGQTNIFIEVFEFSNNYVGVFKQIYWALWRIIFIFDYLWFMEMLYV